MKNNHIKLLNEGFDFNDAILNDIKDDIDNNEDTIYNQSIFDFYVDKIKAIIKNYKLELYKVYYGITNNIYILNLNSLMHLKLILLMIIIN